MVSEDIGRGIGRALAVLALVALVVTGALPFQAAAQVDEPGLSTDSSFGTGDSPNPTPVSEDKVDVDDVYKAIRGEIAGESFGEQVAGIGDVDRDGYDDFLVLVPDRGYGVVYRGPNMREGLIHPMEGSGFAITDLSSVRPAGDIDNDGFDDVLITAPELYRPSLRAAGGAFVFYGSPSGLKQHPDQAIFGDEVDMRMGIDIDCVGDINRDGYNDILVGADGFNDATGMVKLFLGGPTGVEDEPAWEWGGEGEGDRFGHAVTGAGDLNADGWPDFAVGAPFAPAGARNGKVYIFYGGPRLWEMGVGKVVVGSMLRSYFGLSIRLAGDVNNDGFSDLLISAPDADTGPNSGAGTVELYLGSEHGLSSHPKWTFDGESPDAHLGFNIAFLGDVNKDGYDDVSIGSPTYSSDGASERGKVYVFLGGANGFANTPAMVEVGDEAGDGLARGLSGAGDIDDDGFADLLVGVPGVDTTRGLDVGEVRVFRGSDITMPPLVDDAFAVVNPEEGGLLLCEAHPYVMRVTVTHRTSFLALDHVDVRLDPSGEDIRLRYLVETDYLEVLSDPDDMVNARVLMTSENPGLLDTFDIFLNVTLKWGFPSARPLEVIAEAVDANGLRVSDGWGSQGTVVDDLEFTGEVVVEAGRQGLLHNGDWVLGSEELTFTGARVRYDLSKVDDPGTTSHYPPAGSFVVVVSDDLGGEWSSRAPADEEFSIRCLAPASSRPEMTYTVSIETPDRSRAFAVETFVINVDGTEVEFQNPEPSEPVASLETTATIEMVDPLGPGVRLDSVRYQVDLAGDKEGFMGWQSATVDYREEDDVYVAQASRLFAEGVNYIRWQAYDEVGNGPTASFIYPITVDLGSITFSSPHPSPAVWHNTESVRVGITIENTQGIDIVLDNIEYRVSTSPGAYTPWQDYPASQGQGGDASRIEVSTQVRMAEGDHNYIQWRAMDVERREFISSQLYSVRVDLTGPEFSAPNPTEDVFVSTREVQVSVVIEDALSGVAESSILYQVLGETEWHAPDSKAHRADSVECYALVSLKEGTDNYIQWRASDRVGHSSGTFLQQVKVDLTAPSFSSFTPTPEDLVSTRLVEVSVYVTDHGLLSQVAGVDLGTLEYAVDTPSTSGYSTWQHPVVHSSEDVVSAYYVSVIIEVDSGENYVIWRVADAALLPNTVISEPMLIVAEIDPVVEDKRPVINRLAPLTSHAVYGTPIVFDASESYSPQGRELSFTWSSSIDGILSTEARFSAALSEGEHVIKLTVSEANGRLTDSEEFTLIVEQAEQPRTPLDSLWEQVAVVLIIAFVVVTLLLQKFRIREDLI